MTDRRLTIFEQLQRDMSVDPDGVRFEEVDPEAVALVWAYAQRDTISNERWLSMGVEAALAANHKKEKVIAVLQTKSENYFLDVIKKLAMLANFRLVKA